MLQTLRERLVLILIALLPLHAFLVTVATKLIAGPGNAPLAFLALWKETVLGVVLVIALLEVVKRAARSGQRVASFLRIDWIDACIVSLLILSILLALGDYSLLATRYSLGFKYDFVPLVAFFVLRRVSWSDAFQEQIVTVLLAVGWIVAGYGIVSFFLPQSFFTALGYSDLHSLYLPDEPIC
jgi:hypothetical protein